MADLTQEPNAHDKGVFGPVTNRGSLVPLLPPPGALGTCQNTTNGLQPTVPPVAFVKKKAQLLLITKRVSLACYTRCFAT
jgi:hypothetical protein